jgi:hypothetical protein
MKKILNLTMQRGAAIISCSAGAALLGSGFGIYGQLCGAIIGAFVGYFSMKK